MMTADLRALYPRDTEDHAVLRPLTRKRTAPPYERARLAADALRVRAQAVRRADRLGSRSRSHTVAVPAAPRSRPRPTRTDRKAGRVPEQATDVAAMDQTRRTFEAAAAKMAAKLTDGVRDRAVAHGPRPQSTSCGDRADAPPAARRSAPPGRTPGVA